MHHFDRTQLRAALDGISGILVSPFGPDGDLAPANLAPVVDKAVGAGVHVLVANGNTSEFYGLTAHEAAVMVREAARQVAGRVPLLGGVGRSVREACELAVTSAQAGVDALMIHQPPDPFVSPRGVVAYVKQIAEAVPQLPLVLYLRNESIGMEAIEALCRIPQIVGVKWASPTPVLLTQAMRRCADLDIAWVGGLAETWAPALYAAGARGFTSGLINVFPERSVAIHDALAKGDYDTARRLIAAMSPFEDLRSEENNGANVTVVKRALQLMGMDCGTTRPPSAWPLQPRSEAALVALLEAWKREGAG